VPLRVVTQSFLWMPIVVPRSGLEPKRGAVGMSGNGCGANIVCGSPSGAGPRIAFMISAASRPERAIGPITS
jgi:hypothetical protein